MQCRDNGSRAVTLPRRVAAFAARKPRIVALLLGVAAATGFAPLGLWPLTLLCFAGLIALLGRAPALKSALILGYLFGLGHFVLGLNWIAHAFSFQDAMPHWFGYLGVVLLSFYLAVYPAMATGIAWQLGRDRPAALALTLAGSWAFTEYMRATMFTGFAWNPIGVVWLGTGVEQAAKWIGTYGLGSLAIVASGAFLCLLGKSGRALPPIGGLALLALFGLMQTAPSATRTPITVVQPNIDQNEKYEAALEQANFAKLASLSSEKRSPARLLFWPEAAVYAILDMEPLWRERMAALLSPGELLMAGGDKYHFRETPHDFYTAKNLAGANNSLWVLDDKARILGRYDKAHLVPYGEYLPMRPILSAIGLSRLVPGDMDFWPGPGPRTLALPATQGRSALKMGVQICYEIIFSGQVIDRANRPDFLFNPSNDSWFGSWGPPQHLAQARLRAVEEAMPVIRSTPTGISAVVDANGQIVASLPLYSRGAISSFLPASAPPTPFALWGNILPMIFASALMVSGVALARGKR